MSLSNSLFMNIFIIHRAFGKSGPVFFWPCVTLVLSLVGLSELKLKYFVVVRNKICTGRGLLLANMQIGIIRRGR